MGKQRGRGQEVIVQSGVVPYRVRPDGHLQVLLITSRAGGWIVPKGSIDDGLSAEDSARKEAVEEAGAVGMEIGPEIGSYDYEKFDRVHRVRLFAMRVARMQSAWDERDFRQREWMSVDEAIRRVPFDGLRDVLENFERTMQARRAG